MENNGRKGRETRWNGYAGQSSNYCARERVFRGDVSNEACRINQQRCTLLGWWAPSALTWTGSRPRKSASGEMSDTGGDLDSVCGARNRALRSGLAHARTQRASRQSRRTGHSKLFPRDTLSDRVGGRGGFPDAESWDGQSWRPPVSRLDGAYRLASSRETPGADVSLVARATRPTDHARADVANDAAQRPGNRTRTRPRQYANVKSQLTVPLSVNLLTAAASSDDPRTPCLAA